MRPSLSHRPVQGILDPKRRDYAGAFKALSHPAVAAQLRARNESLLLLGHAAHEPLRVPAGVWQHVQQLTGLPYKVGGPGGGGGGGIHECAAHSGRTQSHQHQQQQQRKAWPCQAVVHRGQR